jgi:hypothetical protein
MADQELIDAINRLEAIIEETSGETDTMLAERLVDELQDLVKEIGAGGKVEIAFLRDGQGRSWYRITPDGIRNCGPLIVFCDSEIRVVHVRLLEFRLRQYPPKEGR